MDYQLDTPTIRAQLKELRNETQKYSTKKQKYTSFTLTWTKMYMAIPVVIFIVLLLWRPNFTKDETYDENGEVSRSLSFKKILYSDLIISSIIIVGIFVYKYKTK